MDERCPLDVKVLANRGTDLVENGDCVLFKGAQDVQFISTDGPMAMEDFRWEV